MLTAVPPCAGGRENFINAFAQDFEQHGATVIEKVRKERPQDYLKVAAVLLPKQMEIETARTRPLSELTDAELMSSMLNGSVEDASPIAKQGLDSPNPRTSDRMAFPRS